jgi:hypothetical protein
MYLAVFAVATDYKIEINVDHTGSENKLLAHLNHVVWLLEQLNLSAIFNCSDMQEIF